MFQIAWKYGLLTAFLLGVYGLIEWAWVAVPEWRDAVVFLFALLFTGTGVWVGLRLSKVSAVDVKSGPRATTADLSEREIEILQLIDRGLSNAEIAETLHISVSTVKSHNQNLFQKLDASRRTQAVQRAREVGIL